MPLSTPFAMPTPRQPGLQAVVVARSHRHPQRGGVFTRLLGGLALLLLGLLAAMAWHQHQLASRQTPVALRPGLPFDATAAQAAFERLSAAVQLRTLWTPDDAHAAEFDALHQLLQASFPAAHTALQRQAIGRHALLYTWPGSDPKALPIALMAHQDVVPVAPGTESDWKVPPFSGAIKDGFIWGRGAWDDKGSLMATMEAVEALARAGFKPRQTVYLAFGADEEVGGEDGAKRIADLLKARGVRLRFVLDEGMLITHGMVPGVRKPVALIGMAEKGYVTLQLTAHGQPGHTSMPPPRSAIGLLGEAVARVEAQPMPARFTGLPRDMFEAVAPEADGLQSWLLGNLWLTAPLVSHELQKLPAANAMLRSTGVATIFKAGERENVLPGVATASVNFRLLPGDSSDAVLAHVRQVLTGLDVDVAKQGQVTEPSPVSSKDSEAFGLLARSLRSLQPDVVVAPGLLVGGTDSRYFTGLTDSVFRFSPVHANSKDLARFHGTNERMGVFHYLEMIQFYERLLREANGEMAPKQGVPASGSEAGI